MAISVFDLFKIGIGPSSSHTVGPMRAANMFIAGLSEQNLIKQVIAMKVELFGSLGATGKGHGTDKALILGLQGESPEHVDVASIAQRIEQVYQQRRLVLANGQEISFNPEKDLIFHRRKSLPFHPNGMCIHATGKDLDHYQRHYYSVGGGFVIDENATGTGRIVEDQTQLPYRFKTGAELLMLCTKYNMSISELMLKNESVWRSEQEIREGLLHIWSVMQDCVDRGCRNEGILPGGMKVKRRAARLYQQLEAEKNNSNDALTVMDWVNLFAIAVNEENAAGGRVVTAPTNGAAGIIPAVMHYMWKFCPSYTPDAVVRFLLVAAAIGTLYKENASISGAEVGCQGEVGAACSMAAGALTEILGGSPEQVENAAEIGMEHNLGLTCDPVGGLVQVPCIERNAMGAVKAINASRMALRGDGHHFVSLDKVIKTMRDTGADMQKKYKETARGGLAVNVIEC